MPLDKTCEEALELARAAVSRDRALDAVTVMAALLQRAELKIRLPGLAARLPRPRLVRMAPDTVRPDGQLATVLAALEGVSRPVTPERMMLALLISVSERGGLGAYSVSDAELGEAIALLHQVMDIYRDTQPG